MKKNYIAPNTEMMNLASEGIMQNPTLNIVTGSCTSFSDAEEID